MRKLLPALLFTVLLTGCLDLKFGSKTEPLKQTTGQQLLDLQKAKETGAITEAEYVAQKKKVLETK